MSNKSFIKGVKEGIGVVVIILIFIFSTTFIISPKSFIPSLETAYMKSTVSDWNEELDNKPNMSALNTSIPEITSEVDEACRYNKSLSSHVEYKNGRVSYRTKKEMYESCLRLLTLNFV